MQDAIRIAAANCLSSLVQAYYHIIFENVGIVASSYYELNWIELNWIELNCDIDYLMIIWAYYDVELGYEYYQCGDFT